MIIILVTHIPSYCNALVCGYVTQVTEAILQHSVEVVICHLVR